MLPTSSRTRAALILMSTVILLPGHAAAAAVPMPAHSGAPAVPMPAQPPSIVLDTIGQQYLDGLTPRNSGPGILIGEPVTQNLNSGDLGFAFACSAWLQMSVGGQGEFGKTPLASEIYIDCGMLHRDNLEITPVDITSYVQTLGVTHVVTATASSNGGELSIIYQIRHSDGSDFGKPYTLSGSRDDILRQLPDVADKMAIALGAPTPQIPSTVELSDSEMSLVGSTLQNIGDTMVPPGLEPLAAKSPLAGLALRRLGVDDPVDYAALVQQNSENAYILGGLWLTSSMDGPGTHGLPEALLQRYPYNHTLNAILGDKSAPWTTPLEELPYARAAACDAPRNTWAWYKLGDLIGTALDYPGGIELGGSKWMAAEDRAIEVAPQNPRAWTSLAEAERYMGNYDTAGRAIWWSLKLDPTITYTYKTALDLYSSNWASDPNEMVKTAQFGIADPSRIPDLGLSIMQSFESSRVESPAADAVETEIIPYLADSMAKSTPTAAKIPTAWRYATEHPNDESAWNALLKACMYCSNMHRRGVGWSRMTTPIADDVTVVDMIGWYAARKEVLLAPDSAAAWVDYCNGRMHTNDVDGARDPALKAIQLGPNDFDAYSSAINLFQPKWMSDSSYISPLMDNLMAKPSLFENLSPDIVVALSDWKSQGVVLQDDLNKAQTALQALTASNPTDPKVLEELAFYYWEISDSADGKKAFEAWTEQDRSNERAHVYRGEFLQNCNDVDGAIEQFRQASALDPTDEEPIYWLGALLAYKGQNAEAEADLRKAIVLIPDRASTYFYLGNTLMAEGKKDDARAAWFTAVQLDPTKVDHGDDAQKALDANP